MLALAASARKVAALIPNFAVCGSIISLPPAERHDTTAGASRCRPRTRRASAARGSDPVAAAGGERVAAADDGSGRVTGRRTGEEPSTGGRPHASASGAGAGDRRGAIAKFRSYAAVRIW